MSEFSLNPQERILGFLKNITGRALKDGYSRLNMGLEKVEDAARIEEIRFGLDDDEWGKEIKHDSPEFIQFPKKW